MVVVVSRVAVVARIGVEVIMYNAHDRIYHIYGTLRQYQTIYRLRAPRCSPRGHWAKAWLDTQYRWLCPAPIFDAVHLCEMPKIQGTAVFKIEYYEPLEASNRSLERRLVARAAVCYREGVACSFHSRSRTTAAEAHLQSMFGSRSCHEYSRHIYMFHYMDYGRF